MCPQVGPGVRGAVEFCDGSLEVGGFIPEFDETVSRCVEGIGGGFAGVMTWRVWSGNCVILRFQANTSRLKIQKIIILRVSYDANKRGLKSC